MVLLILCAGWLLATRVFSVEQKSSSTPPPKIELDSNILFQLVNNWRTQKGYRVYVQDDRLCKIALDRADDILPDDHKGLYEKYGSYPYVISENTTYGYSTEQAALDGWLGSSGHLENLEKLYSASCIKCYKLSCVEIFSSFKTDKLNPY